MRKLPFNLIKMNNFVIFFSLNLAQEMMSEENFSSSTIIFLFWSHFVSLLPPPQVWILPNIHVLWTDHVNLSSSHFNDRESYVSSCVLTSPIGG